MQLLVIDGANVVGSRPDGWWRDRAGAAKRLHDAVATADLAYDDIVLVLEGAARRGQPEGNEGRVRTVHATGSGDDTIVELVSTAAASGTESVVVTADRELRDRVVVAGGRFVGPGWLLERTT